MKKNGFTLVELLAVIVVLAVIMSIAGSMVMGQRKKANIEQAKQLENTIEKLGPEVYLDQREIDNTYTLDELTYYGLKSSTIKNPSGNGNCKGYLSIGAGPTFSGYICCPGVYETGETEPPATCD